MMQAKNFHKINFSISTYGDPSSIKHNAEFLHGESLQTWISSSQFRPVKPTEQMHE